MPTYNEADNVEDLTRTLLRVFDDAKLTGRVIIIDDDSPDGTGDLADGLAADDSRVEVIHRRSKEGIGPAYIAGFRRALQLGAAYVVEMDCDFSHDPAVLPDLLTAAESADLVLGSRYVAGGAVTDWGLGRRAISRGGCWYARTLLALPVRDLTGGFKCFRRETLELLPFDSVSSAGYGFQIELTYWASQLGLRILEVPITFRDRTKGRSKMSLRIALEAARLVVRLRAHDRKDAFRTEAPADAAASP